MCGVGLVKMNKYAILILLVISTSGFASIDKKADNFTNALDIMNSYSVGTLTENQYFEKLWDCSNLGNNYCTGLLGDYYYQKKSYSPAFSALQKYFDNLHPNDFVDSLFSMHLHGEFGWMYQTGNGVLINLDKALLHYKLAANIGDGESAFHISAIYAQKTKAFFYQKNIKYIHNAMNMYAWALVAQALGYKIDNKYISGMEKLLFQISRIDEANLLAKKICLSIPACHQ